MYIKDKEKRITLRVNEEQSQYIKEMTDDLGVSPSEYIRMLINISMATKRKYEKVIEKKNEEQN